MIRQTIMLTIDYDPDEARESDPRSWDFATLLDHPHPVRVDGWTEPVEAPEAGE